MGLKRIQLHKRSINEYVMCDEYGFLIAANKIIIIFWMSYSILKRKNGLGENTCIIKYVFPMQKTFLQLGVHFLRQIMKLQYYMYGMQKITLLQHRLYS